jgi:hypothetical protein
MAHGEHAEYREELHGEHPHSYDHSEPKYSLIWILGIVTVVMLIIVALGIQFYYEYVFERATQDKVLSQDSWQLRDLRNREQWELSHYGVVDQGKGTVRIPIDQAMRMVAQEAAEGRTKYPTNPYPVKSPEQLAGNPTGVSQAGAAAANAAQNQGVTSSPHVQQSTTAQQPNK